MSNIRDLMTKLDAEEMEERYAAVIREDIQGHNRRSAVLDGDLFDIRDLLERPFDYEVDAPEFK